MPGRPMNVCGINKCVDILSSCLVFAVNLKWMYSSVYI